MPTITEFSPFVKDFADLPNWVTWRYQRRVTADGSPAKPKKPPYNPHTGRQASPIDPAHWATYAQAIAFANAAHMAGIGLVLTRNLGITLVDLDNCFDDAGELLPWAAAIVRKLNSYTEYSPSRKGLHVLCYGAVAALKTGQVELYSDQRYTTITGRPYGPERPLRCAQAELDELRAQYAPADATPPPSGRKADFAPIDASDGDVIAILRTIPVQAARWAGKVTGDLSRHLYGLINVLIWLCGPDAERIGRLVRQSGLYDPERHERNAGAGYSNLDVSIFNALRTWHGTFYKWPMLIPISITKIEPTKPDPEPAEPTLAERLQAARIGLRYGRLALKSKGHTKDTDLAVADALLDIVGERGRLDTLAIGLESLRARAGLGSTSTARKALGRLDWLLTKEAAGDKVTRADVYSLVAPAVEWLGDLENIVTGSHDSGVNSTGSVVHTSGSVVRSSNNIIFSYSQAKSKDIFSTGCGGIATALNNQTPGAGKLAALLIDVLQREGLPATIAQLAELTGRSYPVIRRALATAHDLGLVDRQKESKAGPGRPQYWYSVPADVEQRIALAAVDLRTVGVGVERAANGAIGLQMYAERLLNLARIGKATLTDAQRETLRTWSRIANIEYKGLCEIADLAATLDKGTVKKTIAGASGAVLSSRVMQAARQFNSAIALGEEVSIKQRVRLFGYWAGLVGYYDLDTTGDSGRRLVTEAIKQARRQAIQPAGCADTQRAPMGWDDLQHSRQVERATAHQERFGVELVYAQES